MPVMINEMEVAPAPEAAAGSAAPQSAPGGQAMKPEAIEQIERAMRLDRERGRRLAAY